MTIAVIANPKKYAVHDPLITLFNHCRNLGIDVVISKELREYLAESDNREVTVLNTEDEAVRGGDIIVAVGGDGTMLYTARL
ncbi:MAG TPA: NAD(+)/NADH kinase, partial [Balneolaceae bacterium]|nr:NAD(+)/NADH kinase [Balneolaceae bacterium]